MSNLWTRPELPQGLILEGETVVSITDHSPMVYIPAGSFYMGSDDFLGSKPVHSVFLDGYWSDVCPVRNAQLRMFVEAGG